MVKNVLVAAGSQALPGVDKIVAVDQFVLAITLKFPQSEASILAQLDAVVLRFQ